MRHRGHREDWEDHLMERQNHPDQESPGGGQDKSDFSPMVMDDGMGDGQPHANPAGMTIA